MSRAISLPTTAAERKTYPVATGVLFYFPDAIAAIAHLSHRGNEQHNPGQPLHWSRAKSADHEDTMIRHFLESGTLDTDGVRHSAKMAWRALAILQLEIEAARTDPAPVEKMPRAVDLPEDAAVARVPGCHTYQFRNGRGLVCELHRGHEGPHTALGGSPMGATKWTEQL